MTPLNALEEPMKGYVITAMIIDTMQSIVKLQVLQQIIYNLLHIKTFLEFVFPLSNHVLLFCSGRHRLNCSTH